MQLLDEILMKPISEWLFFLKKEFRNAIKKCNNWFILELDYVSWRYLKIIVDNDKCLSNIVNIDLGY